MTKPIPREYHLGYCIFDTCELPTQYCNAILDDGQICGQKGHPVMYKSNDTTIAYGIRHTHFLNKDMQDVGRNDFHTIKFANAPPELKVNTWKLYQGPDRYKRIPDNVRHELGWDNEDDTI